MCLSVSKLPELLRSSTAQSMLLQMALFHSFLWLSSTPLYICTTSSYPFICPWTFRSIFKILQNRLKIFQTYMFYKLSSTDTVPSVLLLLLPHLEGRVWSDCSGPPWFFPENCWSARLSDFLRVMDWLYADSHVPLSLSPGDGWGPPTPTSLSWTTRRRGDELKL